MTEAHKQQLWALVLRALGQLTRGAFRSGGLILCFHRVASTASGSFQPNSGLAIAPEFLSALIGYLRRRGIAIVSLAEAIARLRARTLRDPFVSFTFDDGYRDNFSVAFPIFESHNAPFAIFLTTGFVDGTAGMWWAAAEAVISAVDRFQLPDGRVVETKTILQKYAAFDAAAAWFRRADAEAAADAVKLLEQQLATAKGDLDRSAVALTWDMARQMTASGLVTIGCHTVTHAALASLDKAAITREIAGSRDRISDEIGARPSYFAYPYGMPADIGGIAETIVGSCGFDAGFSTVGRPLEISDVRCPFTLPRVSWAGQHQWLGMLDAHACRLQSRIRASLLHRAS